jgi:hypothetical protein
MSSSPLTGEYMSQADIMNLIMRLKQAEEKQEKQQQIIAELHEKLQPEKKVYKDEDKEIVIMYLLDKYPYLVTAYQELCTEKKGDTPVEVYYAPPQTGKTAAAINFAYLAALMGYSTVFITMNKLSHGSQLKKRVNEFKELPELCESKQIKGLKDDERIPILIHSTIDTYPRIKNEITKEYDVDFHRLVARAKKDKNTSNILKFMKGEDVGIIWCIGNTPRMNILDQMLSHYQCKYVVVGDELDDLMIYDEAASTRKQDKPYLKIHKGARMVIGPTATSVKIWLSTFPNFVNVRHIPIPKSYIGYRDLIIDTHLFRNTKPIKQDGKNIDRPELFTFLSEFINMPQYYGVTSNITKQSRDLPRMLICCVSEQISHHREMMEFMMTHQHKSNRDFVSITWNSDNGGLKMYSSYLAKQNNRKIHVPVYDDNNATEEAVPFTKKGFYQFSKSNLGDVLSFMDDLCESECETLGNILVFVGKNANRGVSFVSNNYELHPTDMIHIPSNNNMALDKQVQVVGRLMGDYRHYHDQVQFKLWTNKKCHSEVSSAIEALYQLNRHSMDEHKENNLHDYLMSGMINLPGSTHPKNKFFNAPTGLPTKLDKTMYDMNGKSEVNLEARFQDKNLAEKHSQMYKDNATKGFTHRAESRKFREEYEVRTGPVHNHRRVQPPAAYHDFPDGGHPVRNIGTDEKNDFVDVSMGGLNRNAGVNGNRTESLRNILHQSEHNRLVNEMFPKWSKADTKIAEFMKNINPDKEYTHQDFNKLCSKYGIARITHLTEYRSGDSKCYGKIIEVLNGKYRLYPTLSSSYRKFFT